MGRGQAPSRGGRSLDVATAAGRRRGDTGVAAWAQPKPRALRSAWRRGPERQGVSALAVVRTSPTTRLRLYAGGLLVLAVGVAALTIPHVGGPPSPVGVPWPAVGALFGLTEIFIVDLHFRRNSSSVTVGEIPLVIGLFTLGSKELMCAQVVGAAIALVIWRRPSPIKLLLDLSPLLLVTAVAIAVFHVLLDVGTPLVPRGWVAAIAAAMVQSALSALGLAVAIALAARPPQLRGLRSLLAFTVPASLVNASLGLIAVRLIEHDRVTLALMVVPICFLVIGYRAYTNERQRSQRAEFLYQTGRLIERSSGLESAIRGLLREARSVFDCEVAMVYVAADDNGEAAFSLSEGGKLPATDLDAIVPRLRRGEQRASFLRRIDGEGTGGMVAALIADGHYVGHIVVADLHPVVLAGVQETDLRFLETLAAQASTTIEKERLERTLIDRAYHDALTGLANRAQLLERIEAALARRDSASTVAVIFLDLDDFKTVNDSLGHAAGDELLVAVARRLRSCVRPADVPARLGGDEFAVVLEVHDGAPEAVSVAERIMSALQESFVVAGSDVAVRASAGVVVADERQRSAVDLLRDADVAMYSAKESGKGTFKVFEQSMQLVVAERHRMKEEMHRALAERQLHLLYQPIVRIADGEVIGAEALVRWQHPRRGLLLPVEFIPLAEELGIIGPLGRYVLELAVTELEVWSRLRHDAVMSINVAPRQLEGSPFSWLVEAMLARAGVDPRQLILEVTESVMAAAEVSDTFTQLRELRQLGVRIALDDFGTGYSSLGLLRGLPVDILKVAKPFIDTIDEGDRQLAFANAICRLGESLGLETVAEGVERPSQLERLRALGCTCAQGYLLGAPTHGEEIRALLSAGACRPAAATG